MKVVVIYESRTGNTERAAQLIAARFAATGHDVKLYPTKGVDLHELSEADLPWWARGPTVQCLRATTRRRRQHRQVPADHVDKPTYAFVTYAIRPGGVLRGFNKLLASKGAKVLGSLELHRKHLDTDAPDFVDGVLAALTNA